MIRKTLSDTVLYTISAIFTRGALWLQVPLYAAVFPPAQFGALDIATIYITLITLTVGFELTQGIAVLNPELPTDEKRALAGAALLRTIALYAGFAAAAWLFAPVLGRNLFEGEDSASLVTLIALAGAAQGIFVFTHNQLRWLLMSRANMLVAIVQGGVNIALGAGAVFVLDLGVSGVLVGQCLSCLIGSGAAYWIARSSYAFRRSEHLPRLWRISFFLVPSSLSLFLCFFMDRFFIKALLGLSAVGVYGVAYRFATAIGLALVGFSGALPARVYDGAKDPDTPAHTGRLLQYFLMLSLCFAVLLAAVTPEAIVFLSSDKYAEAAEVSTLIVFSMIVGTLYVFTPGLMLGHKTPTIAIISATTALVNAALNPYCIARFGLQGAALATLGANCLGFYLWLALGSSTFELPAKSVRRIGFIPVSLAAGMACIAIDSLMLRASLATAHAFVAWWILLPSRPSNTVRASA